MGILGGLFAIFVLYSWASTVKDDGVTIFNFLWICLVVSIIYSLGISQGEKTPDNLDSTEINFKVDKNKIQEKIARKELDLLLYKENNKLYEEGQLEQLKKEIRNKKDEIDKRIYEGVLLSREEK